MDRVTVLGNEVTRKATLGGAWGYGQHDMLLSRVLLLKSLKLFIFLFVHYNRLVKAIMETTSGENVTQRTKE